MNESDREILNHFDRTRAKTIELLQRIPDNWLQRTAAGEEHALGKLFAHIASAVDFWMEKCLQDGGPTPTAIGEDKTSIIESLEASRQRLLQFFSDDEGAAMYQTYIRPPNTRAAAFREINNNEQFSGRKRVLYLTQHEVHHRGKIVLAIRQWGFPDIPFIPY